MADNKTISKLQINQTTYDLGGSGGSSEEPIDLLENAEHVTGKSILEAYRNGQKMLYGGMNIVEIVPPEKFDTSSDNTKFEICLRIRKAPNMIIVMDSTSDETLASIMESGVEGEDYFVAEINNDTTIMDCWNNMAIHYFSDDVDFNTTNIYGRGSVEIMQNTLPNGSGDLLHDISIMLLSAYGGLKVGHYSTTSAQYIYVNDIPTTSITPGQITDIVELKNEYIYNNYYELTLVTSDSEKVIILKNTIDRLEFIWYPLAGWSALFDLATLKTTYNAQYATMKGMIHNLIDPNDNCTTGHNEVKVNLQPSSDRTYSGGRIEVGIDNSTTPNAPYLVVLERQQ